MGRPTTLLARVGVQPRASASSSPSLAMRRRDITDRLGLPADADNETILAAVDAVVARKQSTAARAASSAPSEDEELYARWAGERTTARHAGLSPEDSALLAAWEASSDD